MKKFKQAAELFCLGGMGYAAIEIAWRGYTHWTMVLTGGLVFFGLYLLEMQLIGYTAMMRYAMGMIWVTSVELLVGMCVNCGFQMQIWDYSTEWGNLFGQICPKYMLLWLFLCGIAMPFARESAKLLAIRNEGGYNAKGEMSEMRFTAYAYSVGHRKQPRSLWRILRGRHQICCLDSNRR